MNLLQETIKSITESNHEITDIKFIGSLQTNHACTWLEFTKLADCEYDNYNDIQNVATDLLIVFSDGSLMVRDIENGYIGIEFWNYLNPMLIPEETSQIDSLFIPMGVPESLEMCQ